MTREKEIEKKAKEISDIYMPDTGFTREDLYYAATEMAQWKDKQIIDLFIKFIDTTQLMSFDNKGNICIDKKDLITKFQQFIENQ